MPMTKTQVMVVHPAQPSLIVPVDAPTMPHPPGGTETPAPVKVNDPAAAFTTGSATPPPPLSLGK
jgi:hypothetical protein